jgi:hypothetical protein
MINIINYTKNKAAHRTWWKISATVSLYINRMEENSATKCTKEITEGT